MQFNEFSLRPEILRAVDEAGYRTPTPIQEQAIPVILTGADLLGIAQTGTGKTAAFVLPMIERLASGQAKARMPRSLILSPTRELATQTAAYFETYGKYVKLNMALLIGGVSLDDQARQLERGVDVLIATPGRLLDQFERGRVLLGGVSILVIDEADRMLDMGFIPDVERIVKLLPRRQQTMMFSATMPKEIRRLASAFLENPQELQAAPPATRADGVEDHLAVVPPRQKFKALQRLIESQEVGKAIIFCNRKREVASLRRQLERAGLNVRDIHGDLDQPQRTQALEAFKRGEIDFLVATDVAARGLDIQMLPCVINYDVPTHADDYVHRIGRTARAGQEGRAFTLALPEDGKFVDAITRLTGKAIPLLEIPGVEAGELAVNGKGRRRRGKAEPAAEAVAPAPAPAERPERPSEERPEGRRGRRARNRNGNGAVAERAAETAEAPGERPEPPAQQPQAAQRSQPEPRAEERPRPEPEAPAAQPAPEPAARPGAQGRRSRRRGERAASEEPRPARATPVVGMGEHVPLFMRRAVPAALLQREPDEL